MQKFFCNQQSFETCIIAINAQDLPHKVPIKTRMLILNFLQTNPDIICVNAEKALIKPFNRDVNFYPGNIGDTPLAFTGKQRKAKQ